MIKGVTSQMLSGIKNWKVGTKYVIEVTAELKELEKEDDGTFCCEMEVKKIKEIGEDSKLQRLMDKYER